MQLTKHIPYYIVAVALFVLLKFGFTMATNGHLIFLLKPTDTLVGILTGSHSIFVSDQGYFHKQLHIVIDKSCSGFNFWMLSFLLITYIALRYLKKPMQRRCIIPIALLLAYIVTIVVNTSRIFVSIVVHSQAKNVLADQQELLHEAIGITTNLTFLILIYIFIDKFLNKKTLHEKLT